MSIQRPKSRDLVRALMLLLALGAAGAASSAGPTGYQQGKGGTLVDGAAGPSGATGHSGIQRCDKPYGAVAVVEPQSYVMQALSRRGLQSPTSLIRLMVQQSNCFIVVDRGMGMQNLKQERKLADAGELRAGANMGGGQMVPADYVLTPTVVFSEDNAGAVGAAVSGVISRRNPLLGSVASGLKFQEAQTSIMLTDARSGVQVAVAEGSTRKADLNLSTSLLGTRAGGTVGGYGKTNEGKIIAAALLDNFNNVVTVVRGDTSLQRNVGTLSEEASRKITGGAVFNEGDVVTPKIANVKLLASPAESAEPLATLVKSEELVVIGAEQNGYINVQSGTAAGWVRKVLLSRH
jgi:Curli production assembly/transport component CsgG